MRIAFVARPKPKCGALPPVDLRAVCLVLAIVVHALILSVVAMLVRCGDVRCCCNEMSGRKEPSIVSPIWLLILVLVYIHG
jgi:hypothetical protein